MVRLLHTVLILKRGVFFKDITIYGSRSRPSSGKVQQQQPQ